MVSKLTVLLVVAVVGASIVGYLFINNYLAGRGIKPYLGRVSKYVINFKEVHLKFNSVCKGIRDVGYVNLRRVGSEGLPIGGTTVNTFKYIMELFVNDSVRGPKNGTFTFWISSNGTIYKFYDSLRKKTLEYPKTGAAKLLLINAIPMMAIDDYFNVQVGENGVYIPSNKGLIINSTKSSYVVNGESVPSWVVYVKPPSNVKGDVKLLKMIVGKVGNDWYILSITMYGKEAGCVGTYSITTMKG